MIKFTWIEIAGIIYTVVVWLIGVITFIIDISFDFRHKR